MKVVLKEEVVLFVPSGKITVPVQIVYDDSNTRVLESEISLIYNGIEYKGSGKDYLWTDTLADLELKLPQDVRIACCMTCRHGNMCPFGNKVNELTCTKDLIIGSKRDMCDLFDQTDSFEKRAVPAFAFCEDFVYQSEDYYTYNDYLYQRNKIEESREQ